MVSFEYRCPECHTALTAQADVLTCVNHHRYAQTEGIWQLLTAAARQQHARFLKAYYRVREVEGWARPEPNSDLGPNAAYYLALPDYDLSGLYNATWKMRGRNFWAMTRLLPPSAGLRILDLGAGNTWMCRRLAERGHQPLALDISMHPADGLPTADIYFRHLPPLHYTRAEGEFTNLPLQDAQFDVVIANASLHYATDLPATLTEVWRVLRADGTFILLDSPTFRDRAAGEAMVAAIQQAYRNYRLPVAAVGGFLTEGGVAEALAAVGFHDIGWHGTYRREANNVAALWRRLKAAIRRGAEQPSFPIVLAHKGGAG